MQPLSASRAGGRQKKRPGWWLVLLLACGMGKLHAGPLYRCENQAGERVYTAQARAYRHCHLLVGSAGPAEPAASAPAAPLALPAQPIHPLPARPPQRPRQQRGAVYRITRRDGSTEYTNRRPAPRPGVHAVRLFTYIQTCLACDLHSRLDFARLPLQRKTYAQAIAAASQEFELDVAWLRAVIQAESGFNPYAVSAKGAAGLMQLMPATAARFGVRDVYDPEQNIRGGAHYLASLLRTFHGDKALATAAYNAGPQAVLHYGGLPPYPETQVYVQRVGLLWARYRRPQPGG